MPFLRSRLILGAGLVLAVQLLAVQPLFAAVDMGGKKATVVFSDAEIDKLMDVTGLTNSVSAVPALVRAAVERARPDLTDDERLALSELINNGKATSELLETVRVDVRSKLNTAEFKEISNWFSGPVGKKLMAAEKRAGAPEGQSRMQEFVAHGNANAMDFDRSQVLRDLDFTTRASATQKLTLEDFLAILSQVTTSQERFQEVQKGILLAQRDLENQTLFAMSFVYDGIPDEDLRAYVNFYRTPTGQKWVDVVRGLTRSLWRLVNQMSVDYLAHLEKKTP